MSVHTYIHVHITNTSHAPHYMTLHYIAPHHTVPLRYFTLTDVIHSKHRRTGAHTDSFTYLPTDLDA